MAHAWMILSFIAALCVPQIVNAYTLSNVTALRKSLFENYDKISRPMMDQSAPTEVTMSVRIVAIHDVDEVTQTLTVSLSVQMEWLDEALMWNSDEFEGIQTGVYPQNNVWKPGVTLKNSVDDYKPLGDSSLNVIATSNGTVYWEPYHLLTSRCVFDTTYFPFDKQTCDLVFVTWGYTSADILMKGPDHGSAVNLDNNTPHPEWNIDRVTYETTTQPRPMIIFNLFLERKPKYVVLNVILPVIVLTGLNVCVFLLPTSTGGAKTGFGVTVFLSFVVFSSGVHRMLPVSSENFPHLSVFIIIQMFESAIITLIAVFLLRLQDRTGPVPTWLTKVLCNGKKGLVRTKWNRNVNINTEMADREFQNASIHPYTQQLEKGENRFATEKDASANIEVATNWNWAAVIQHLERLLLLFFLLLNILITIVFFVVMSTHG